MGAEQLRPGAPGGGVAAGARRRFGGAGADLRGIELTLGRGAGNMFAGAAAMVDPEQMERGLETDAADRARIIEPGGVRASGDEQRMFEPEQAVAERLVVAPGEPGIAAAAEL